MSAKASPDKGVKLVKLSDSNFSLKNIDEDIRNRKVVDQNGDDIGEISALFIDERDAKVRFIEVASGGFLGLGETKFLLPVEAIWNIQTDTVHIDQRRERLARAPGYNPDLTDEQYYEEVYGYYGYTPYWWASYTYPPFPYYRRRS